MNVWLAVSDSSSPLHLILPSAFNSIHLRSVSVAKSVLLLLHNTAQCEDGKVLRTIQIYSATPTVHLHSLTWMPYLDPEPFMHFVLLMISWMPNTVVSSQSDSCGQLCNTLVNFICCQRFLLPYSNSLSLQETVNLDNLMILLLKNGLLCIFTLLLFSPLPLAPVPSSSPSPR